LNHRGNNDHFLPLNQYQTQYITLTQEAILQAHLQSPTIHIHNYPFYKMNSLTSFKFVFLTIAFFVQGTAAQQYPAGKTFKPGYCNVCRDAPNNNVEWRNLVNPGKSFSMNGEPWTCGYLQDTVQDVNPYNGADGEARWCALAQTFAENHCDCVGPQIPSLNQQYKDQNKGCDLCQGQQLNYVPSVNSGITANTGVAGNMNCEGLYNAMSQGVLTSNLCPIVVQNAGPTCCSLQSIEIGNNNKPQNKPVQAPKPQQPVCTRAAHVCKTNNDCCPGLQCKVRIWNGPKYCSSRSNRPRQSIAGRGVGGAAGRSRAGN